MLKAQIVTDGRVKMIKVEGERVEIRGNGVEMLNDWVMITSALYSDMSNDLGKEVANSLFVQALFEAVEIGSSIDEYMQER